VWVARRAGGLVIPDKTEDPMTGIRIGEPLKFEPFMDELSTGKWRFYSYLQHHVTDKGLSNIYAVQTAMDPSEGLLKIQKIASTYLHGQGKNISRPQAQKMRHLFKSTLDALVETNQPSW
jgi:hypothetical protein